MSKPLAFSNPRPQAKTGREELKKLRKEYLRIKDELEAERGAHSTLQVGQTDQLLRVAV